MSSMSSVSKALWCCGAQLVIALAAVAWCLSRGLVVEAVAGAVLVGLIGCALHWLRRANRSIGKAVSVLKEAADGHFGVRVGGVRGRGNIGRMLHNINHLLDQTEALTKEIDAAMTAASEGRFHRKVLERGLRGEFRRYATNVNTTLDRMGAATARLADFESRMLKDAVTITMTVNEGAIANARIVSGIRTAVSESQGMAAATEEMVSGIHEISHTSGGVSSQSGRAREMTDDAKRVVDSAIAEFAAIEQAVADAARRVATLAEASDAIAAILSSIEAIASQTNLLALNATIEAARAGEAGKGFAVVATEVKNLAVQTAKATEDIGLRIANLRGEMVQIGSTMERGTAAIANGRESMQAMGSRMGGVSGLVTDTADRMGEMARVLSQQAAAANQISSGVQRVASQAEENAVAIESSSQALLGVEGAMTSLLATLADRDIPNKIIMLAKADHAIWKKRLVDMLIGKTRLYPDELANDKSCRLGKWYYGPGSMALRGHPAFIALAEPHRQVHANGIEAARAFNAGDLNGAMNAIAEVEKASKDVLANLDRLITEPPPSTRSAVAF